MILTIKTGMAQKNMNEVLKKIKPVKKFDAQKHLGKMKWNSDGLAFQKQLRHEWD